MLSISVFYGPSFVSGAMGYPAFGLNSLGRVVQTGILPGNSCCTEYHCLNTVYLLAFVLLRANLRLVLGSAAPIRHF